MSSYRRSHHQTPMIFEHDIRFENRNSEEVHDAALAESWARHQRVLAAAVRVGQLEEAREEQLRLQEENLREAERVRLEEERVREEIRKREIENREKQIPKVPARVPTPPQSTQSPVQEPKPAASPFTQPPPAAPEPAVARPTLVAQQPTAKPPIQTATPHQPPSTHASNPFAQTAKPTSNPFAPAPAQQPQQPAFAPAPAQRSQRSAAASQPTPQPPTFHQQSAPQSTAHLLRGVDRYVEIHKKLKELRKWVNNAGNEDNAFKKAAGELRRTLRMSIGQCVSDKSKNKGPINKIFGVLQQSLTSVLSPGIDPSLFMLSKPEPVQGAAQNGEQLPALFLFLLNFFSKYVVSQFLNEAGVKPELADPIGVVVAQVFSRPEFLWRGESMIDILMAKIRVTCPALFGVRGNEATEEGRAGLGWIRDESGSFVSEQVHGTRMVGMAAGYAALSLRDFSKSRLKNPWHPTHYWQTMASIVNTPPSQRSTTQYIILRWMIEGYEGNFLKFYGNTARAALKVALVDFPEQSKAQDSAVPFKTSAVGGVGVLADKLERDRGIKL